MARCPMTVAVRHAGYGVANAGDMSQSLLSVSLVTVCIDLDCTIFVTSLIWLACIQHNFSCLFWIAQGLSKRQKGLARLSLHPAITAADTQIRRCAISRLASRSVSIMLEAQDAVAFLTHYVPTICRYQQRMRRRQCIVRGFCASSAPGRSTT